MLTLSRLLSRLPLSWLHAFGALLGWLTWLLSPTYRRHLREKVGGRARALVLEFQVLRGGPGHSRGFPATAG